jgi:PAS domain S-box-containing protein
VSPLTAVPSKPVKVLVVEDDRDARENLRDILELDDYVVETASTAAEALDRRGWSELSAVILDRRLPDGNAHDLLPALRRLAPGAAFIMVTGYSDVEGAIEALRLGAADYLLKPINADALRLRIRRVVEQRRLAQAKEQSDALFRLLVETAECMILILRADNSIAYFSPFAEVVTEYPAAEVVGRDFLELFVPEEERAAVAEENSSVFAGRPARGSTGRVVCRDGSHRWVVRNSRLLPYVDESGVLLIVAHDITELKQAQDRAIQTGRLAAIGQMVAGLAHESRNALQRSQACLDMLALKISDRLDAQNLIERIQCAQDDLQRLFEDVRNYSAPISLERRMCDLREVWRETWSQLVSVRPERRDAELNENFGAIDVTCEVDPFRLGQVFRNIFDNALAATPDPVAVEIHVEELGSNSDGVIRIAIRDNGPGMNLEQRRKIFESFFTTKTRGTGLGMAIVKRIVEAHGGQIEIGGHEGPGAEILLNIPRRSTP